ncbi:AraC family transcriptional regulator [Flagellimonas algicola]|uniref:AraC family transcriptional regulator n=1 Tax=Flagellimonas algicola TaxID=2583815 RepID=A0ABY2WH00_9FLAO|nr:AraC family transcriptional regulator [Allomuricauda algicola]TMU50681.1 AraC family transcriptional regulator [Allomuricauda algicola]
MVNNESEIQKKYSNRLNKVFQYIDENLDSKLSLCTVSEKAFFSPFHFHRIFKLMTGETLNEFITRRRIEKSVLAILHKKSSLSEISHMYGFGDNSAYTKAFKKYYGISPTEFKSQNPNKFSKTRQLNSKIGQSYPDLDEYVCIIDNLKKWMDMNAKIEIKQIPEQTYVYITCIGPHGLPAAFQKLITWAIPNGFMTEETKLMTVYQDSLKVTEEEKARFRACLPMGKQVDHIDEFETAKIPSGKYIVGKFEIILDDFEKSWTGLYVWMDENNYERAEGESFEVYHNNFNEHPKKIAIVDFYIPIK